MLVKAKNRDIYIDVDSFDLLEKEKYIMKKKYCIVKLTQTCCACPSQWDAITTNNSSLYIRYRWGYLAVYDGDELLFSKDFNSDSGRMSTDELIDILAKTEFDFTDCKFCYEDI